ncbi:hypothetical protein B4923_00380 [Brenneria roseae subsp. americana]|uniref:Uncharacterized protein n=1 Tax=Brenneria roseae subsp. americana TaxID=1508507 RepID=A0A2U1U1S3_9GAMM|nr:hypothetical protein B4923_00380 [Brenneria roseae subsp. americana]
MGVLDSTSRKPTVVKLHLLKILTSMIFNTYEFIFKKEHKPLMVVNVAQCYPVIKNELLGT